VTIGPPLFWTFASSSRARASRFSLELKSLVDQLLFGTLVAQQKMVRENWAKLGSVFSRRSMSALWTCRTSLSTITTAVAAHPPRREGTLRQRRPWLKDGDHRLFALRRVLRSCSRTASIELWTCSTPSHEMYPSLPNLLTKWLTRGHDELSSSLTASAPAGELLLGQPLTMSCFDRITAEIGAPAP
jgi:hypothetical protein